MAVPAGTAPSARGWVVTTRADLSAGYDFILDRFQVEAIDAIDADRHVVVAAPTGSGKTVVAEYAIERSRRRQQRSFYTAPMKALSNQKYRDLVDRYGTDDVGLLTGDNVVNPEATIVVMTTEVLRNMIYAQSDALDDLGTVILDEVHFLQDAYRGPVWEEVMIHAPAGVRLVCLSATISNAGELADWIETVRGPTNAIVETRRPVSLTSHYLVGDRTNDRIHLLPIFVGGQANSAAAKLDSQAERWSGARRRSGDRGPAPRRRLYPPGRVETVNLLHSHEMLPAIYFIFSRNQCAEAARTCFEAGIRFTDGKERTRITEIVEARLGQLDRDDLEVLGYDTFVAQLEAGIAAHHAGMVPPFKEVVERCFVEGLVKVVFATETLAVGINMPARTVVIEKLTKFTGEHHEFLTPGDYTQLTGRAGRRGLDDAGQALVLWSPFVRFEQVATLAASRMFHLRSVFRPTYNMVSNLVASYRPDEARHLLSLSFAQYQADRDVVRIEARLERKRSELDELLERAESPYGDVWAYRRRPDRRPGADGVEEALAGLRPGEVIWINQGKYAGPAVVAATAHRAKGLKVSVVTAQAALLHLTAVNFTEAPQAAAAVVLPDGYAPQRPQYRRDVARRLADLDLTRPAKRKDRSAAASDPIEADPELRQRLRAAGQAERTRREIENLTSRLGERTSSLALEFDRVLAVLDDYGYVDLGGEHDEWSLTEAGTMLARLFHESELLVAECLRAGVFDGLSPAELAGLVSVFVYEHRSPDDPPLPWFPSGEFKVRWRQIERISVALASREHQANLAVHRPPDPTFVALAFAWVAGEGFAEVIGEEDLSGGDFVRTMKQLVDLLRQIGQVAPSDVLRRTARRAATDAFRDVVADASLAGDE